MLLYVLMSALGNWNIHQNNNKISNERHLVDFYKMEIVVLNKYLFKSMIGNIHDEVLISSV